MSDAPAGGSPRIMSCWRREKSRIPTFSSYARGAKSALAVTFSLPTRFPRFWIADKHRGCPLITTRGQESTAFMGLGRTGPNAALI